LAVAPNSAVVQTLVWQTGVQTLVWQTGVQTLVWQTGVQTLVWQTGVQTLVWRYQDKSWTSALRQEQSCYAIQLSTQSQNKTIRGGYRKKAGREFEGWALIFIHKFLNN